MIYLTLPTLSLKTMVASFAHCDTDTKFGVKQGRDEVRNNLKVRVVGMVVGG